MDMPPILAALECNPQKLLREARNEFATSRGFCRKRFGTELESFRFGALPLEVGRDGLSQLPFSVGVIWTLNSAVRAAIRTRRNERL